MTRADLLLFASGLLAACQCAGLKEGLKFTCDAQTDCLDGVETCVAGYCETDGGMAGGSGGAGGGAPTCADAGLDVPDDLFLDSDCDGMDGTLALGVFVDPVSGSDLNDGTSAAPVQTLAAAFDVATHRGSPHIYLASGVYSAESVKWEADPSLYGGYTPSQDGGPWSRDSSRALLDGGTTALLAVNRLRPSRMRELVQVDVRAAPASVPSERSVALHGEGVLLTLRHVTLVAGDGAHGLDGGVATDGVSGEPGHDGGAGSLVSGTGLLVPGGQGGASPCGQGTRGGDGTSTNGMSGQDGGAGGAAAGNGSCVSCPCMPALVPDAGSAGPIVQPVNGASGGGGRGGSGLGSFDGGAWVAAHGRDGQPGNPGRPGRGGGAGGAARISNLTVFGSSGGGGGGAGCPGGGGAAGQGGGASIALLLFDADVTVADVKLVTGSGGNGGAGAPGGAGGQGGAGGLGGPRVQVRCIDGGFVVGSPLGVSDANAFGAAGGDGSRGGNGGSGGPGGGGGGGPSVGAWCEGVSIVRGGFTTQLGPGGQGAGDGGTGQVHDQLRCGS